MKRMKHGQQFLTLFLAAALIITATTATATDYAIDTTPPNGLFDIYSATFDPPLTPDGSFFGGTPPASRAIVVTPTPTGVEAVANTTICKQDFIDPKDVPPCPLGTLYPVATPSTLDLTLSAGNTQLAIDGGNAFFPNLSLVISGGTANQTDIVAEGASMITFAPSPGTVPIDGNGVAVFEIDIAPATAVDFATFTEIVTSCQGPLCALIPILTLDMQRYRLTIDWDPTFTSFTADFIGQTANNSMVFATLNSVVPVPDITVTDSIVLVDDLQIPFGNVNTGMSVDETVTVTNDGDADLVLGQITQPAPPFSVLSDLCSNQTLAPAANCTLTVRFAPSATGAESSSFDIPSNDPIDNLVTVDVDGTGVAPEISVSDSVSPSTDLQIPFDDVAVATTVDETITVTNIGTADLNIDQIAQPAAPFSVLNDTCSNQLLAPAAMCTLTVRFAPSATGMFSDTVDIPSNDPDTPTVAVNINGTGVTPVITVTASVDFGDVTVMTDTDQDVTVTNTGDADLILGTVTQPNLPFSILTDNCSLATLLPAEGCTITVRFSPTSTIASNDSFDIPSNDLVTPTATVSVSGTGTAALVAKISVTDTINFGSVIEFTTDNQTVTVTSSGTANLDIGQITQPGAPFGLTNDLCSNQTLAPAANCTLTVQFTPAGIGLEQSSFDIPSNDLDKPTATVNVIGTGAPTPVPEIVVTDSIPPDDDREIPFGDVIEMTTANATVTVTNNGTANLDIDQITLTGASFSLFDDLCSIQTLALAAMCTFKVQFAPPTTGVFNGSVDIPSNDTITPTETVDISGTGTPTPVPEIGVTDSVPFGDVIETMVADETVTITNNGTANLDIGQITQPGAPFGLIDDLCSNQALAPAANCTFKVQFAPPTTGAFNGSVDIPSNDPNSAIVTVTVDGTGAPGPAPDISVADEIPPKDDLMTPYGDVVEATDWDRVITIMNDGNANLQIGMIAQAETLAEPFSIVNDTCSGQIIAPAASADPSPSCSIEVRFLPSSVSAYDDSFDIPSDDPDEPVLIFNVSGNGVALGTGVISLEPEGADSALFGSSAIRPVTLLALLILITMNWRRRYHQK